MGQTCKNCKYSRESFKGDRLICCRFPPAAYPVYKAEEVGCFANPVVVSLDWECGEWRPCPSPHEENIDRIFNLSVLSLKPRRRLSGTLLYIFKKQNIKTIGDLIEFGSCRLINERGVGEVTLLDITDAVHSLGTDYCFSSSAITTREKNRCSYCGYKYPNNNEVSNAITASNTR